MKKSSDRMANFQLPMSNVKGVGRWALGAGHSRRAFSLIEILVVAAILLILLMIVGGMLTGKGKDGKGQSPVQKAQGTVCMNNLNQIRQGIQIAKINNENEANPQSLAELKFPAEVLSCPDGKTPYQYDPVSGEVKCTYPFHQKY